MNLTGCETVVMSMHYLDNRVARVRDVAALAAK